MAVHQVVPTASPADPTTRSALALRTMLREVGDAKVFSPTVAPVLAGEVLAFDGHHTGADPAADTLCVHAAPLAFDMLDIAASRPERIVLVCQSFPDVDAVRAYDARTADDLHAWGAGVRTLFASGRVHRAVTSSAQVAEALVACGCPDVRVAPPFVDLGRWHRAPAHAATAHHLAVGTRGPLVVSVVPLWPDASVEHVVEAFHVLATYLVPDALLAVAGGHPVPRYASAVQELIYELNLAGAWLSGPLASAELVAYYRRADVFVTAARDGVSLASALEASSFGVPVVARGVSGVDDELDRLLVRLAVDDDACVTAEAMAVLLDETGPGRSLRRYSRDNASELARRAASVWRRHLVESS